MQQTARRQLNPVKVRAARVSAGLSKAGAASAAQLSLPAYYRWEDEGRGPLKVFDVFRAECLARSLSVPLAELTDPLALDETVPETGAQVSAP